MVEQISVSTTKWNASQLSTMPGWIGVGVAIPFVGVGAEVVFILEEGTTGLKPGTPVQS